MKRRPPKLAVVTREPNDTPESEAFYAAFYRCLETTRQPLQPLRAALGRILPQQGAYWWVEDCARHAYNLGFWKVYRLFRDEAGATEEPQQFCAKPRKGTARDRKLWSAMLGAELIPSARGAFRVKLLTEHKN